MLPRLARVQVLQGFRLKPPRQTSFTTHSTRRQLYTSPNYSKPVRTAITVTSAAIAAAAATFVAVYFLDSRSALHRYVITPVLRRVVDAETGQRVAVNVLGSWLAPREVSQVEDERLAVSIWEDVGKLQSPVGLAAGFDKNGEAIDGLFGLGFSWVEVGSVTPRPQAGNPQPRVFHLPEDSALINRYGFPSKGATFLLGRLKARVGSCNLEDGPASRREGALLAINLGKNKDSPTDSINDFLDGVRTFAPYADVLVVNVSSPNTPGLRSMQTKAILDPLLSGIISERGGFAKLGGRSPKLVLKISPDLSEQEITDIASSILEHPGIDGVIVSNTTVQRPTSLMSAHTLSSETGGLSGPPLKPLTLRALKSLRKNLPARVPIIACGGVESAADILEYAEAGACAVQAYTAFGYDGVGWCARVKEELKQELEKRGVTWAQLVNRAVGDLSLQEPKENLLEKADIRIQRLVQEAEDIKRQLERLAATM